MCFGAQIFVAQTTMTAPPPQFVVELFSVSADVNSETKKLETTPLPQQENTIQFEHLVQISHGSLFEIRITRQATTYQPLGKHQYLKAYVQINGEYMQLTKFCNSRGINIKNDILIIDKFFHGTNTVRPAFAKSAVDTENGMSEQALQEVHAGEIQVTISLLCFERKLTTLSEARQQQELNANKKRIAEEASKRFGSTVMFQHEQPASRVYSTNFQLVELPNSRKVLQRVTFHYRDALGMAHECIQRGLPPPPQEPTDDSEDDEEQVQEVAPPVSILNNDLPVTDLKRKLCQTNLFFPPAKRQRLNAQQVSEWILSLNDTELHQYAPRFLDKHVDQRAMKWIVNEDLESIGVAKKHRDNMIQQIRSKFADEKMATDKQEVIVIE